MKNKLAFVMVMPVAFTFGALVGRLVALDSQDSQKLAVKFENDKVRVLELRLKPGEAEGCGSSKLFVSEEKRPLQSEFSDFRQCFLLRRQIEKVAQPHK